MTDRSSQHVLVVDDEAFMLKLIAHMLAELGFGNVETFDGGAAALAHIDAAPRRPDLILCDLNMPGMDGIEFLRKLGERAYAGGLIVVSGEDDRALQATLKLAQAHGMSLLGALHKPFTPTALRDTLRPWQPQASASGPKSADSAVAYGPEQVAQGMARGEFLCHFQPQVAVATGEVLGVECLARWQHPTDGMVYPDQFVGVAEEHGLIDDLTRVVLAEALAHARTWQDAKLPLRVAVNISMDTLAHLDFVDFVTAQVTASGVASQRLILEVTESRLMHDLRAPLEVLTRLRLRRIGMSIDDFGTGHSSMVQLRNMPFDELKIDKSFVHGAATNDTLRAIHEASLGLAMQLGLLVVAEGVEDRADWDLLLRTGCPAAQGYFIARPMPPEQVVPWMATWAQRYARELAAR